MKKRLRKKLDKQCAAIQRLSEAMTRFCGDMQTSTKRLQGLMAEMNGSLSRFPNVVKDWATCPPIHQGEYVIWFVRKDWELESRKYTFAGGKWYGNQGEEIDIRKYKPSMWMLLPTFDPGVIEIYKRRQE